MFGDPTLASVQNIEHQQDAGLCINNACSVKYVYHGGKEKKKKVSISACNIQS